jgi:hypothetical protein
MMAALIGTGAIGTRTSADDASPTAPPPNLVRQANAPISSILQLRLQDAWAPEFTGASGQGQTFTMSVTMPLPKYRLLPLPQLSLLTLPAASTLPDGSTGVGDLRFTDVVILDAGHRVIWGVGPAFVFPSSSGRLGQGKWQAGPAAVVGFAPERWLVGVLAQNPISFAGASDRPDVNALFLLPFVSYQFEGGWFVRSQPQMIFNWKTGGQLLPVDVGAGRVFKVGRQNVSCFIEPSWNVSHDGPAPRYAITFGISLLYPNFWQGS